MITTEDRARAAMRAIGDTVRDAPPLELAPAPRDLPAAADEGQLGGHGVIKNDSTVVMRVEMDAAHGGRQAPYLHWRGVAFDQYEHGSWMRSRAAPSVSGRMVPSTPGMKKVSGDAQHRQRSM